MNYIQTLPSNGLLLGNVIDQRQLAGGHTSLDISTWLPGVYWIQVELDGKSVTKKLIKMH
ncbi:MAG: T9SS type A sorting domain-containing protein [Saprospiraceae bacterium]|nr:T9SS type A sorting domain-containing protein [Saprospiraceae bacterium]